MFSNPSRNKFQFNSHTDFVFSPNAFNLDLSKIWLLNIELKPPITENG